MKTYKPASVYNCIVKRFNNTNISKSGLYIKDNDDTQIYEIVSLHEDRPEQYQCLSEGDKVIMNKGWRGFHIRDEVDSDGNKFELICMDLPDVIATII